MKFTKDDENVQGHPASFDAYLRHGWKLVAIPPGTKGPNHKGWNLPGAELKRAADLPQGQGVGILHAYSYTGSVDIDDWATAAQRLQEEDIDLRALYEAPDAVTIESGRQGRGKLLYKMPWNLVLPSKKLIRTGLDGRSHNYLDFRCGTRNGLTVQDVLPPTIHPDTGQSYRWGGRGHWSRLPMLPPALMGFWNRLIDKDSERSIGAGAEIDASWDDIKSALARIPPDVDRERWVAIGMALHWAGTQTDMLDEAFLLWDEWSRGPDHTPAMKYQGPEDLMNSWPGFKPDSGRTLGTLFHIAKQHGWTRPVPPAEEIFADVTAPKGTAVPRAPVDVLAGFRPPPPSPNLTLWPKLLSNRASEVADGVGCDPLVSLFAGLAAVAGCVDAQTRLELVPGYQVPPVIWAMTIGSPADKKSPGSYPMLSYLYQLEREGREQWKQDFLAWEAQEKAYKEARIAYLDHWSNPMNAGSNEAGPALPHLPDPPVPPKLIVQDITSQKLVRHCAARPRGMLCYLDEMSSWARKLTDPRAVDERSSWVLAYEAKRYDMGRVGEGDAVAENFAVSVYGNIQPRIVNRYIAALSEDGTLQRFIPAILRPAATWKGNPVPDEFTSRRTWESLLKALYEAPSRLYRLHPDARQAFSDFQDYALSRQQDERTIKADEHYQTALGKITGTCGRLALMFHLIENPGAEHVTYQTMERAIRVTREYIIPSLRYTFSSLAGPMAGIDDWLVSHVIQMAGTRETVSLDDLRRAAGKRVKDLPPWQQYQVLKDVCALLEACNWLRCVEDTPAKNRIVWAINPSLADTYLDYKDKVKGILDRINKEQSERQKEAKGKGFPSLY